MDKPRLGHIDFINCLPLDWGLTRGGFGEGIAVCPGFPARLNAMVTAGDLDVSPVSSIEYARNADRLVLLPGLSISAPGALQSIVVVAKRPLAGLDGRPVALTAKSATSHVLLKIILREAFGVQPVYSVSSRSLAEGVLAEADAVLFIGDDALNAYHHCQPGYLYYDLGAEWRALTGGPMVYAVWVANRDFAARRPDLLQQVYDRIKGGFAYGLANLEAAAADRSGRALLSPAQIIRYIGLLDYRLTEGHLAALAAYYRLARDIGALETVPGLAFAGVRP